ncbi:hypothetical protein [Stenotrophomonas sp.]|uniref:hypothetical protein n=1 Tax=Stenotrophomonas sp. TaxID=69392 RepID=UPI002899314A|nr:hypothetical protein [Stenotrophomonas sp.]
MTSKHSPGPWSFQNHGSLILDARSGSSQTLVAKVEVNTYRDEGRYNARLIASAPELLAIVATFDSYMGQAGEEPEQDSNNPIRALRWKAQQVLAKAIGFD